MSAPGRSCAGPGASGSAPGPALPAPLLVITARALAPRPLVEVVARALAGGCRWLLVREKDLAPRDLAALLGELEPLAHACGAVLSLALPWGELGSAWAGRVAGLHLPAGSDVAEARRVAGRACLLGVSAHSLTEAKRAAAAGASYVTLSPIFPSASKPGYGPALGLEELAVVAGQLPIPVVALGGVAPASAPACLAAGAAAVAVMGGIMRSARPEDEVALFKERGVRSEG